MLRHHPGARRKFMSTYEQSRDKFEFDYLREDTECVLRVYVSGERELSFQFHTRPAGADASIPSPVAASGLIPQEYSGDCVSTSTYLLHRLFSHRPAAEMEPLKDDHYRMRASLVEWIRAVTPQGTYYAARRNATRG